MLLIDTDVMIWYLRGNEKAKKIIDSGNPFRLSVVSYMELVQGMRNNNELRLLRAAMREWGTQIIYLNEEVSSKAVFYIEQHFLSNSLEIADALIAATAVINGFELLSGNTKHFRIIKELNVKQFRSS
jgi:hypothetical protein